MTALCLVIAEIPFCFAVLFYPNSPKRIIQNRILREQSPSALCCFCSDCTSARFFRKHFGCAKKVYFKNKKCSVALAVNKSKPDRGKPVQAYKL